MKDLREIKNTTNMQIKADEKMYKHELEENYVPKEAIREKLDKLNIKIEQYNDYRKLGKETDVEYYENIINMETKKVLEEILGD